MSPSAPQQHNEVAAHVPRPAKPDYSNVFIEPVYGDNYLEADPEDELEMPATSSRTASVSARSRRTN
ncbi:hypothetical protein [Streptomyces decoyicus]|uniref:hypothetical protein n=1 Tax=Streptomyces decoyicus TaxID=249567 RepID=UPI0004AA2FE1|nr:hypothetical protein [Streptomyces decoyicus]KOG38083.1 hypothetical protein ADK74_34240 [Streptomyces decoyicus]QZY14233.1 hypothetical protein K7C20_02440 [Streptomyces decoyicus]